MAFGFDPSIILQQRQADPLGAARSFADLVQSRQATEAHQATLADMVRKREQDATMRSFFAQHADNPQGLVGAMMRGGLGPEALPVMERFSDVQASQAARENALQQSLQRGREQMGALLYGTKDQADYESRLAQLPAESRALMPRTLDQAKPLIEAWAIPAKERVKLTEEERHNRAMEARPSGVPPLTIISGEGGIQYLVNTRQPNAPAVQVKDEGGNPVVKVPVKPAKPLNQGDRDRLEALNGQARSAADLLGRFKDDFAGKGWAGGAIVAGKQTLGSWAPEAAQEEAAFWADFGKMVDLPERNKTFGASLTDTEKRSWEQAKNIKPGASPKIIRAQLAKMQAIAQEAARRRGRSLAKDGYSQEAIEEFTGSLGLKPKGAQLSAEDQAAKRWADANPGDPRAQEILRRLEGG